MWAGPRTLDARRRGDVHLATSRPADFGISYALLGTTGWVVFETVTADPTGCPGLRGLDVPRWAAPAVWDQLAVALGLSAPREYCDPFRGRLPTAPARCGPGLERSVGATPGSGPEAVVPSK